LNYKFFSLTVSVLALLSDGLMREINLVTIPHSQI